MFFIMGISQAEKMLPINQLTVCKGCGRYGRVEVFMTYTYFMLFFIPIVKWNKQYFVKMNCCGLRCEISKELGKAIEQSQVNEINLTDITFDTKENNIKQCDYCGFTTSEDYQFCPKCGRNL